MKYGLFFKISDMACAELAALCLPRQGHLIHFWGRNEFPPCDRVNSEIRVKHTCICHVGWRSESVTRYRTQGRWSRTPNSLLNKYDLAWFWWNPIVGTGSHQLYRELLSHSGVATPCMLIKWRARGLVLVAGHGHVTLTFEPGMQSDYPLTQFIALQWDYPNSASYNWVT
jgi:hypothetical protein